MAELPLKCPCCGAGVQNSRDHWHLFVCGTSVDTHGVLWQSRSCLEAELAAEKKAREKAEASLHDCDMTLDAAQRHIKEAEAGRALARNLNAETEKDRAVLYRETAALVAERDRLRGIVDKLPKTADGVPIGFDTPVYYPGLSASSFNIGAGHVAGVVVQFRDSSIKEASAPGAYWTVKVGECYSTREAAEAAATEAAKEPDQTGKERDG